MAPSTANSKFEIDDITPPHACYRAVAEASIGSGISEEGTGISHGAGSFRGDFLDGEHLGAGLSRPWHRARAPSVA